MHTMRDVALALVWLAALSALVLYLKQMGVRMNVKKLKKVVDSTPNGKLLKAADNLVKARALLKVAKQLAEEAGVPLLAERIGHTDMLADQSAQLADAVIFNADPNDYLPATKSAPGSISDRDTVKTPYSRPVPEEIGEA